MEYADRIGEILRFLNTNQRGLAERLGVSRGIVSEFASGRREPSKDFMIGISKLGISIDWFITGNGPLTTKCPTVGHLDGDPKCNTVLHLEEGQSGDQEKVEAFESSLSLVSGADLEARCFDHSDIHYLGGDNTRRYQYPKDVTVYRYKKGSVEPMEIKDPEISGMVYIPVFCQSAAAGSGQPDTQLVETDGVMPVVYELFGAHNPRFCGICRVVGDSMTDIALSNGDWVIFDRSDSKGDGIFVISMFGEVRVKRLQYRLADRKIVISSENSRRYPEPEVVGADVVERGDLVIHGRVFSWMHKHPY